MHAMSRWCVLVLTLPWFAAPVHAQQSVAVELEPLLLAQRYADAKTFLLSARDDPARRDDATLALLELAFEDPKSAPDGEWRPWHDAIRDARIARDGDRARSLATLAAWRADVAWRERNMDAARAGIEEALGLLATGNGTIARDEHAFVEATAAQVAGLSGEYDAAAAAAERARVVVAEPRSGLERLRLLRALYFKSLFEERGGHLDAALVTAREGLAQADALGVPDNGYRVRQLGGMCEILLTRGDFAEVRRLMRPVVERLRATRAPSPRQLAMSLGHLAEAERNLGDREAALALYRESADVAERDPTLVASGSFAAILGNLGTLAFETGHYDEADRALARNRGMIEQQFGAASVRLVPALIDAGEVALARDLFDEAEEHFRRALAIVATELGPEHPEGAPALRGLARTLLAQGRAETALPMLRGALAQRTASNGPDHPELLTWRCDLALAQAREGDIASAIDNALAVDRARNRVVAAVAPVLGETQALDFKRGLGHCRGLLLALTARRADPYATLAAWEQVAAARGLATRTAAARLAHARSSVDTAQRANWDGWVAAARRYALAIGAGAPPEELAGLRRDVDVAVESLGAANPAAPLADDALRSLLGSVADGVVVVAYTRADVPVLERGGDSAMTTRLYAFVASSAVPARLVDLGDAAAADAVAQRWYALLRHPDSDAAALAEAGTAVRKRVFDPLGIAPDARVRVVADGVLHQVNFAALPDGDGYLIERGLRVHSLDTEHDLALPTMPAAPARDRGRVLLVGAPNVADAGSASLRRLAASCPETAGALAPLPGAQRELATLGELARSQGRASVTRLSGREATASALRKAAGQADLIHFATHTIEIGKACAPQLLAGRRGVGLRSDAGDDADDATSALAREAGLLLTPARDQDGLLLSADVATLPLDHAKWIVLSACDTGLGARLDDEGVFGLRRAFRLAGARTVVMSLWQIDDVATADWMVALYRARMVDAKDTPDAMASAALAVIAARREKSESTHPFYWGGFVASGDWR